MFPWLRKFRFRAPAVVTASNSAPATERDDPRFKPLDAKILRQMWTWMVPYRSHYARAAAIAIAVSLLELTAPKFIQHLVDYDIPGGAHYGPHGVGQTALTWLGHWQPQWSQAALAELTGPRQPWWNIGQTIGLWALAMLLMLVGQRYLIYRLALTGQRVIFNLRRAVFEQLQRLSMNYYDHTAFGRILTRGTSDIDAMTGPLVNGVNTIVTNTIMMLVALGALFWIDWRIALSVVWLGPVLYGVNQYYRRRIGRQWQIVREGYTRVSTNMAENINGMRVVNAFNRQEDNLETFNLLQSANTENNVYAAKMNGIYQPILTVLGYLGKVIVLLGGCYMVLATAGQPIAERYTVGMLIAQFIYWDWFMNPVLNFGNFHNEMMMAMASAERVFHLLAMKPEVQDTPTAQAVTSVQGGVQFEQVVFGYRPDTPVLHGIDFTVAPGQTVALVGHTGCGKSTIISLLCRFYQPQSGRILLDGVDLRQIQMTSLHRHIGIVSQNNFLFSGTVLDNIRYARPQATEAEVIAAATALGCHDIIAGMSHGYHTPVGERGSAMSLGQRQLICFCRAFLADPKILMLDEATSAVDTHTEVLIQQALERLVAHRTTFVVAHRLSTVIHADLVLVIDHGRIIERGTHTTLVAAGGHYARLYQQFSRGF